MNRRPHRLAAGLLSLFLLALAADSCKPNTRTTHEIRLGVSEVHLTNAAPQIMAAKHLSDDPFYSAHSDQLNQIGDLSFQMTVSANRSSRLRLDVYVSDPNTVDINAATKICDFNLLPGDVTPPGGTDVRVFNETNLRNLVLGKEFNFYLMGQADVLDVDVKEATLIIQAKFVE
jgi:hypothetical protein